VLVFAAGFAGASTVLVGFLGGLSSACFFLSPTFGLAAGGFGGAVFRTAAFAAAVLVVVFGGILV
jgi:hypothetical protein